MKLMVELEGKTVPLDDCEYVLWKPCGCPRGVTIVRFGPPEAVVTEDDAWRAFFPRKRERDKAQRDGLQMELMTHERYCAEVYPLMRRRECPHKPASTGR